MFTLHVALSHWYLNWILYILWQGVAFNVFEKGLQEVSISWTPPSGSETRTLYFV